MLRRVGTRVRRRSWFRGWSQRLPALTTEFDRRGVLEAAARAPGLQGCAALAAELDSVRIFEATCCATHRKVPAGDSPWAWFRARKGKSPRPPPTLDRRLAERNSIFDMI